MVKLIGASNLIKSFPRISDSRERITNSCTYFILIHSLELVIRSLELLIRSHERIKIKYVHVPYGLP